jgi:ABC-2 type transport system permease protein
MIEKNKSSFMTTEYSKSTYILLAVKQTLLIGYMLGLLWIRRHPTSAIFSAATPFSLLFVVFIISDGQDIQFAIAGGLVMAVVSTSVSVGSDAAYYKIEYKLQDIFVASPVSSSVYMIGLAISQILFNLPSLVILVALSVFVSSSLLSIPLILATALLVWEAMTSIGFFIASKVSDARHIEEVTTFIGIILGVLPPVFYTIDILQVEILRYLAYAVPTTHASLIIQDAMGFSTPSDWSAGFGFSVLVAYAAIFTILAKVSSVWRDK